MSYYLIEQKTFAVANFPERIKHPINRNYIHPQEHRLFVCNRKRRQIYI